MNVLFVTADYVSPLSGGISRVTYLLAEELRSRGMNCVSAYLNAPDPLRSKDEVFVNEFVLKDGTHDQQIRDIIETYNIDYIIVQGVNALMNRELILIHNAIQRQNRDVNVFFVFHQMPGYELCSVDAGYLLHKIFTKECIKSIKQLLIQIVGETNKRFARKRLYYKYHIPYANADKIILLSDAYIDDFNIFAEGNDNTKYASIPNMLTYSEEECGALAPKTLEALIVARMDEPAKRIKRALQIWNSLPQAIFEKGWRLTIVGEGEDLSFYRNYVEKHRIKNVSFEGRQNPLTYYQRASIFIMTSAFEGWPMTLMEAMQNGCVPIVFDSFKAVYNIVENDHSGVVVSNNDTGAYCRELGRLMNDGNYRKKLAQNAVRDCQRFNKEHIVNQWMELFSSFKQ